MSFVDMEITRRQFAARYVNVGRAMLATLADIYGLDADVAENWADAIDREAEQVIVATRFAAVGGIEGMATANAIPSPRSDRAAPCPEAAPGLSHPVPYPVGSRRGSGAVAALPAVAAPEQSAQP